MAVREFTTKFISTEEFRGGQIRIRIGKGGEVFGYATQYWRSFRV
jgi:hypothetical protein